MLCSRCGKNEAKITVEYATEMGKVTEYFCESCFEKRRSPAGENSSAPVEGAAFSAANAAAARQETQRAARCPFCGNTMEDYLHSGLVGCAECYQVFAAELVPYIVRLQGGDEHCGKRPSSDPKYEAAASLREILQMLEDIKKQGKSGRAASDEGRAARLKSKAEELKLLLFGDDEEE